MKKSILSLLFALLGIGGLTTSCEDMLTPDMDRYVTEFSGKDTVNFYLGIMNNLQGMIEQNVLLGELRGDLVAPTEYVSDSVSHIINFDYANLEDGTSQLLNRAAYYKVINQCNFYLAKADSMALKNNNYYMRRELAQVQLIRAWTYLQLVQNYGEVPFIVEPVSSSETGWELNPPLGMANHDNLLQKLEEHGGLKQAYAYTQTLGYPHYGEFNNGQGKFSHRYMIFDGNLVYGDLCLYTAKTKADYERAATFYHEYLDKFNGDYVSGTARGSLVLRGAEEKYMASANGWLAGVSRYVSSTPSVLRTMIPSTSNDFFGQMLTRVPQIYGFDATSKNESKTKLEKGEDGKDKSTTTTTGIIKLVPNYRNRQVEPSMAYTRLSETQDFVWNEVDASGKQSGIRYLPLGDQRMYAAAPLLETEVGRLRFIQKFGASSLESSSEVGSPSTEFSYRYGIPIYSTRQIYLRFAEAINRAGFPRHAFAVIRDGLSPTSLPTLEQAVQTDTIWKDPATKTDIDSIYVTGYLAYAPTLNGATYIGYSELSRASTKPFLDFTKFEYKANQGTRVAGTTFTMSRGAGNAAYAGYTDADTLFTYTRVVDARNIQEAARQGKAAPASFFSEEERRSGRERVAFTYQRGTATEATVTFKNAEGGEVTDKCIIQPGRAIAQLAPMASDEEIAAVETLIADELALETAFDGYRYYDLMRMAYHRNAAGQDGNSWLAWLISRRGEALKPYEQPTKVGTLFEFLKNEKNWYLPAPQKK